MPNENTQPTPEQLLQALFEQLIKDAAVIVVGPAPELLEIEKFGFGRN